MQLDIQHKPNIIVASFCGELDENSAIDTRKKLDMAIELTSVQNFVFDFEGLNFMDSTGIGVLLGRYKKLKAKNMCIYISNPNSHIDKILNMAGIYTIMQKIAK
ncbi:MAG: anti-sigma factor antagonist [Clostridia bacterium]